MAGSDSGVSRLKQLYLPQIESLYAQCIWLKDKINLDYKTELRKNEEKLINFIQMISSIIHELGTKDQFSYDEANAIESKIATIILPIRAKLFSKLRESIAMPVGTNATDVTKSVTRCVSYDDVVDAMHGLDNSNQKYDISPVQTNYMDDQLDIVGLPMYDPDDFNTFGYNVDTREFPEDNQGIKKKGKEKNVKRESNTQQPLANGSATSKKRKVSENNLEKSVISNIAEVSSEGSNDASNRSNNTSTTSQDEEILSTRLRRRLTQIVPNPRKVREADYFCSVCNEGYRTQCDENPWWAVYAHSCPKCHSNQIPRIDITLPANAIEIDPNEIALYGEGVEDSGDEMCDDDDSDSDSIGEEDPEERAKDAYPFDGEGMLTADEASKLLVLMCHARTCNGSHRSTRHSEVCKSTKFLMLHIRDCNGIDVHGRECQYSWCFPCKFMLRHLSNCFHQESCKICNPWNLSESFKQLKRINDQRAKDVSVLEAKILSKISPMCGDCSFNNTMTCSVDSSNGSVFNTSDPII